jgi:hypothetical protein
LTREIAEVDAEERGATSARDGISFDFAMLLMQSERARGELDEDELLRIDNPASFARPLGVENLFVEVWLLAVLAAPSPRWSGTV